MAFELGLRGRVLLIVAATATASGVAAGLVMLYQMRRDVTEDLERRAPIIGRALEESREVQEAITGTQLTVPLITDENAAGVLREFIEADRDLAYIVIVGENRAPFLHAFDRQVVRMEESAFLADVLTQHFDRDGGSLRDGIVRATRPLAVRSLTAITRAWQPDARAGDTPPGEADALPQPKKTVLATALLGLSPAAQLARIEGPVRTGFIISGLLVVTVIWFFFSWLYRRIDTLSAYAHRLASGDLTERLHEELPDEVGDLGHALESITQNLGETISRVRVAATEMDAMSEEVLDASRQIETNAATQAQAVQQTASAMSAMSDDSRTADAQVRQATRAAEDSAARLREVSAAIESIAAAVSQLAVSVDQGQSQVHDNIESLRDVDGVVARLHEAVEGTAAATAEISASIRSVDRAANRAFEMSTEASVQAESGVEAVEQTREGIQEIREFTTRAVEWIQFLSEKVASIEQILDVIADIANQTRLVSLNASIIASQAGEHGRGFVVVADEIKALAAKTSGSTREIGGVINEVLDVSGKVMDVVTKGVATVDEATARSEHANRVLDGVLAASTQTGTLMRGIASAMNEQSQGAQRVDNAMQDVHATAISLRDIVANQKRGGGSVEDAMARMRELMSRALQTSSAQAEQVNDALTSMASVFQQIRRIQEANESQAGSRQEVASAFELVERMSDRHRDNARSLATAVERAAAQLAGLTESVKVFRV